MLIPPTLACTYLLSTVRSSVIYALYLLTIFLSVSLPLSPSILLMAPIYQAWIISWNLLLPLSLYAEKQFKNCSLIEILSTIPRNSLITIGKKQSVGWWRKKFFFGLLNEGRKKKKLGEGVFVCCFLMSSLLSWLENCIETIELLIAF